MVGDLQDLDVEDLLPKRVWDNLAQDPEILCDMDPLNELWTQIVYSLSGELPYVHAHVQVQLHVVKCVMVHVHAHLHVDVDVEVDVCGCRCM